MSFPFFYLFDFLKKILYNNYRKIKEKGFENMITINNKEINGYDDYQQLNGDDLIAFMKTQPAEDIMEFKQFCSTPKVTNYADGTTKERETSFFEMRNWVLDRYAPGIRTPKNSKKIGNKLLDRVMEL